MTDDVINFSERTSDIKGRILGVKENKINLCRHSYVLIDDHTKMIECEGCGYIMTPYEYVLKLAKRETNIFRNLKYAKMEQANLNKEMEELKRNIRNMKSQLKRTVEKIGIKTAELNKSNYKQQGN